LFLIVGSRIDNPREHHDKKSIEPELGIFEPMLSGRFHEELLALPVPSSSDKKTAV
jgi:hypothetical protein